MVLDAHCMLSLLQKKNKTTQQLYIYWLKALRFLKVSANNKGFGQSFVDLLIWLKDNHSLLRILVSF